MSKQNSKDTTTILLALPKMAAQIEHNAAAAQARLRLAFERLVFAESAGPDHAAGAAGDAERAIDNLQSILDNQQQQLGNVSGSTTVDHSGNVSRPDSDDQPCEALIQEYRAAIAAKQYDAAKTWLDKYTNCENTRAGAPRQVPL